MSMKPGLLPKMRKDQLQRDQLLTHWVAPFDSTQTQNYLKKYVHQNGNNKPSPVKSGMDGRIGSNIKMKLTN